VSQSTHAAAAMSAPFATGRAMNSSSHSRHSDRGNDW
jgi:hypothetical protein